MQIRMTIHLDEQLLADAVRMTGETSKSKAVAKALAEYTRAGLIAELRAARGKLDLDLDDWWELRHGERAS